MMSFSDIISRRRWNWKETAPLIHDDTASTKIHLWSSESIFGSCFRVLAMYTVLHLQRTVELVVSRMSSGMHLSGSVAKHLLLPSFHVLKLVSTHFIVAAVFFGTYFLPRFSWYLLMKSQWSASFILNVNNSCHFLLVLHSLCCHHC